LHQKVSREWLGLCSYEGFPVKNLLISLSLVAVGVWYFHRVAQDRAHLPGPEEQPSGEIVVANAPDGILQSRWQTPPPFHKR
jgi:hypothetical protein